MEYVQNVLGNIKHKTYVNEICAECGLAKEHTHPSWYLTSG